MIKFNKLYKAKIVDNNDQNHPDTPGKKCRVKIFVDEFMKDWNELHYPWARPFSLSTGCSTSTDTGSCEPPEKDSYVFVFFGDDERKKFPFFLADYITNDTSIGDVYETNVQSSISGQEITAPTSAYPDNKFKVYKNGIVTGVSSNANTPEMFWYHPSGSCLFLDKDGKILIKSAGNINIEAGTVAIEKAILGETLKTKLENLYDELTSILSNIQALTVGTPMGPSTVPVNVASFITNSTNIAALKAQLAAILSGTFKHN